MRAIRLAGVAAVAVLLVLAGRALSQPGDAPPDPRPDLIQAKRVVTDQLKLWTFDENGQRVELMVVDAAYLRALEKRVADLEAVRKDGGGEESNRGGR